MFPEYCRRMLGSKATSTAMMTVRFKHLQQQFEDPMTEVHLFFYQSVLQQFVHVNKFMQLENPIIPILHDELHHFLRKLFCHFLDVRRVKEVGAELIDPYDDLAQRTDQQLDIGFATKNKLGILVHDGYNTNKIKLFYCGVRSFYVEALTYG